FLSCFFFSSYAHHPPLPSFPTRRSSDLAVRARSRRGEAGRPVPRPLSALRVARPVGLPLLRPLRGRSRARGRARRASGARPHESDRKSTRLNSSHVAISYAVFCLKKKKK